MGSHHPLVVCNSDKHTKAEEQRRAGTQRSSYMDVRGVAVVWRDVHGMVWNNWRRSSFLIQRMTGAVHQWQYETPAELLEVLV